MLTHNEIKDSVIELQKRLTEPGISAPIYVRVRTDGQNMIIPVSSLSFDSDGIVIDNHVFNWNDVTSIEALCDSKRNPVFLSNYDEENESTQVGLTYANSI